MKVAVKQFLKSQLQPKIHFKLKVTAVRNDGDVKLTRKLKWKIEQKQWIQRCLVSVAGFGFIAYDVFGSNSLHILAGLDIWTHNFVLSQVQQGGRIKYVDIILSNSPILLSCFGWAWAVVCISIGNLRRGVNLSVRLFFVFLIGGAYFQQGDPLSVTLLKTIFRRPRPSNVLNSFSFPSGHTTSATFVSGVFINILLPLVVKYGYNREKLQKFSTLGSVQKNGELIPAIFWGITSCGRILADAHWLSDTLAGLCLGWTIVSVLVLLRYENQNESDFQ